MKKIISLIFLLFLLGCIQTQTKENKVASYGNIVSVDYFLYVNITNYSSNITTLKLYDTSLPNYANQSIKYNPKRNYEPLIFNISKNTSLLPGFVRAIIGMKEGENKTFVLKAEEGYGEKDPNKIFSIKRVYNKSRYEKVPKEFFKLRNISIYINKTLSGVFKAKIINISNKTVILYYEPVLNKTILYNGLKQKIINFTNESMTFEILGELNHYYILNKNDKKILARLIKKNETDLVFDYNPPLAGKDLRFTVILNKIID